MRLYDFSLRESGASDHVGTASGFKNNLIGMYMLFFWIIANYDNLEKTRIVLEEYDVD